MRGRKDFLTHSKLTFIGFGNVGRALARLLVRKQAILAKEYGISFSATGIATGRHGFAVNPDGLNIEQALALVESDRSISSLSSINVKDAISVIRQSSADVMFENSPVNHESGQPAIDHCRAALRAGMHTITANKGTVVHGYPELSALAKARGKKYYFESTVLGGSPVFSVFRETMPAADLLSFRGVLNNTTNIILSRMENGESFDQAVRYCQSIGVAETDPSNDVDGWDAAIKVAALVTVLMAIPLKPQQVERKGIREITPNMIAQAKAGGKRYKLICSAERSGDNIQARVAPELVSLPDPLYSMENSTTGVTFRSDVLGDYSIIESEREGMISGPVTTAYGLFADFINAVKSQ
jgi:homoserine dehydrogenase